MKIQVKNKRQEVALEIDKYVNNVFSDKFSEIYSDIEIINIEEAHIIGQINDRNAIIIVIISVLIGLLFSLIYISIISKEGAKVSKETEKEIKLKQCQQDFKDATRYHDFAEFLKEKNATAAAHARTPAMRGPSRWWTGRPS